MVILGIDPGSLHTGYGVIVQNGRTVECVFHGTVHLPRRLSFPERLGLVYCELVRVIEKFAPDGVAVEDIFYAHNVKTALKLGHIRGAVLLSAVNSGVPVYEYTPLEVKQAVVGYGRATKEQVAHMVSKLLKINGGIDSHASDALAVALCHVHTHRARSVWERK